MKITKSIILSAVAALIVAAGPEAAAPLVGGDISAMAQAVKPTLKCKVGTKLRPKGTTIKGSKKKSLRDTCVPDVPLKAVDCAAVSTDPKKPKPKGMVPVVKTVKVPGKADKTVTTCKKPAVKPVVTCKLPKVLQTKGTIIGSKKVKNKTTGMMESQNIVSKADRCVLKKK